MQNIFGSWSAYEDISKDWFDWNYIDGVKTYKPTPNDFPKEEELLFASYGGRSYEGDAFMLWKRDGKLDKCHGCHRSCYGLEDQFEPEETSLEALKSKEKKTSEKHYFHFLDDHDEEAIARYWEIVSSL